jgi:hypothetical protein
MARRAFTNLTLEKDLLHTRECPAKRTTTVPFSIDEQGLYRRIMLLSLAQPSH